MLAAIGLLLWLEGGPHSRTPEAWLLLVVILIISALPELMCGLFCETARPQDSGPDEQ